jgi:cellulose synthase/poly-beta-1,6-N-acetylglucosamine synthase-like glycosyltransferase
METQPRVSVIVPCLNEENTIRGLLEAISRQTFPLQEMEVLIVDGGSEDNTLGEIKKYQREHNGLKVRVVENPKRIIPAALNLGVQAAAGEYIVRLDAHSVPHPEYIARSVSGLEQRLGENVGGVWKIIPSADTWIARSIAAAAAHPLGVGDAKYRYADTPGEVDTVPFGGFRREYLLALGGFDESLLTNEDYELNTRIRQAGGKLWLDPNIQVQYYSRSNLRQLARQYARYGYWKQEMLRRYPGSLRWRQALPPLFVLGLLVLLIASCWLPAAGWLLLSVMVIYAAALTLSGIDLAIQAKKPALLVGVPLVIAVMHLSWGGAFLFSAAKSVLSRKKTG